MPEVQSARRFELLDASGRVRAVLGDLSPSTSSDWFPGISLLDEEGHERLSLMLTASGPLLSFAEGGNVALELGLHDLAFPETTNAGPFVVLCDHRGRARWAVRIDADGNPVIVPGGGDEPEDEE